MTMFYRLYHISATVYSVKKQGAKLCKMINPKNNKRWYPSSLNEESNFLPSVKSLSKVKYEPGKRGVRRLAMLNKLFMKQITDLMSTGTVAMNVVGRGIEISKVNITPDMSTVNVFWVCKGNSKDSEIEETLNKIAGVLRHELSTLRVMGEVPYITFVKDKQEARIADLDRRLADADYGEDYSPTDLGHLIKTEFSLDMKLSPEMKAKIRKLEDEIPVIEQPIPEMTHNVYGLDHAKIMGRLLAARKRNKDAWTNLNTDNTVISYRTPTYKTPEPDAAEQKQQLADFLLKRQILQNKMNKQLRNSREDWQLAEQSDYTRKATHILDDDVEEEDDYCDDEDDYYENIRLESKRDENRPTLD